MGEDHLPERSPDRSIIGRFLHRLRWSRQVGPASVEAIVEVRELNPETDPPSGGDSGDPPA